MERCRSTVCTSDACLAAQMAQTVACLGRARLHSKHLGWDVAVYSKLFCCFGFGQDALRQGPLHTIRRLLHKGEWIGIHIVSV